MTGVVRLGKVLSRQDQLVERLTKFALDCANLLKSLSLTEQNKIYGKQLIRSSSSIGANYVEATVASSKKEFSNCVNIARREAKESLYWLDLLRKVSNSTDFVDLVDESEQILRILSAMVKTSKLE